MKKWKTADGTERCRVLVVDDAADARDTLAILIKTAGHDVRTACDGREALESAIFFRPRIIFLDIGLPDLDGYEVCSRLRARPESSGALIYAVTGYGTERHRIRSKDAGFDGHLVKPLDPDPITRLLVTPAAHPQVNIAG